MLNSPSTLMLLWHLAALRVTIKFARLERALRKSGYDPSQPRAPSGSSTGGQWIDDSTTTLVAANDSVDPFENPGLYSIDLEAEDRKGGHGFSKHVGRKPADLLSYLILNNGPQNPKFQQSEGSFRSRGEANNLISQVLRLNAETVQKAIRTKSNDYFTLGYRFGFVTGIEAYQADQATPPVIRPTYAVRLIITHDPLPQGRGYRVVTAFPMNDVPNEIVRTRP